MRRFQIHFFWILIRMYFFYKRLGVICNWEVGKEEVLGEGPRHCGDISEILIKFSGEVLTHLYQSFRVYGILKRVYFLIWMWLCFLVFHFCINHQGIWTKHVWNSFLLNVSFIYSLILFHLCKDIWQWMEFILDRCSITVRCLSSHFVLLKLQ